MSNVQVTSFNVAGTATEQVIAPNDGKRKYISVQCKDPGGKLGIGDPGTVACYIDMAANDVWESLINITSQYRWLGDTLNATVFQDRNSDVCLSYDITMLTYSSRPIYYNRINAKDNYLSRIPVFS